MPSSAGSCRIPSVVTGEERAFPRYRRAGEAPSLCRNRPLPRRETSPPAGSGSETWVPPSYGEEAPRPPRGSCRGACAPSALLGASRAHRLKGGSAGVREVHLHLAVRDHHTVRQQEVDAQQDVIGEILLAQARADLVGQTRRRHYPQAGRRDGFLIQGEIIEFGEPIAGPVVVVLDRLIDAEATDIRPGLSDADAIADLGQRQQVGRLDLGHARLVLQDALLVLGG